MKPTLKVIMPALSVAAFFAFPTTTKAQGTVRAMRYVPQPGFQVLFENRRIEGQFIIAHAGGNTTVNLHVFDGGTFCEIQGTVQFGRLGP